MNDERTAPHKGLLRMIRVNEADFVSIDEVDTTVTAMDRAMKYWDDLRDRGKYLMAPRQDDGGKGLFLCGDEDVDDLAVGLIVAMITDPDTKVRSTRDPWERYAQPWSRYAIDERAQVWSANEIMHLSKEFDDEESRAHFRALHPGLPSRFPCPYLLGVLRLDRMNDTEWNITEMYNLLRERKRWGRVTVVTSGLTIKALGQKYGADIEKLLLSQFAPSPKEWVG